MELLVVIIIIGLLIAIIMPSLTRARDMTRAVSCAGNMRSLAMQMAMYAREYDVYPPSYLYPYDSDGNWDWDNQPGNTHGYIHWSYFLLGESRVTDAAFRCPSMSGTGGGIPRTNPGPDAEDWEPGQHDINGQSSPNKLEDWQAARTAYTANAAVIPRNKSTRALSGGQRVNVLISPAEVRNSSRTIMLTEFLDNWRAITSRGDGALIKSHRPVNAFYHVGSGTNEYKAPLNTPGYIYGKPDGSYGLAPYARVMKTSATGLIDGSLGTELNAIGRHHVGGDDEMGGTTNFVFCDGHVERTMIVDTIEKRQWGDKYYTITGANKVVNY
jgi:prepilin-type processing-associated H-X9-DG protein